MATTTKTKSATPAAEPATEHQPPSRSSGASVPAISRERLPYHPAIEERFGIDRASWRALVEAVFPLAQSIDSVLMALSYCRARKLDPFKRVVHIVPIWDNNARRMVDTVWPGIGELRTTAFRTGQYAGRDRTEFGPDITRKVGNVEITFPEWAQVTLYRMIAGQRVAFQGPQVYWTETYASRKRDDASPNSMWEKRPRGQIDKCAEAAALRAAFPEEIGNEFCAEEAHTITIGEDRGSRVTIEGESRSEQVANLLEGELADPAVGTGDDGSAAALAASIRERIADAQDPDDLASVRDELDHINRQQMLGLDDVMALRSAVKAREAEITGEPEKSEAKPEGALL